MSDSERFTVTVNNEKVTLVAAELFAFLAVEAGCKNVHFCDDGIAVGSHAWVAMDGNNRVYDIVFAKSKGFDSNYNAVAKDYRVQPPRKTYIGG